MSLTFNGVPEYTIDVIPHGISSVPFASSNEKELGIEGKSVTFTFGLLSPDKGIEHVIDALPVILARYPDRLTVLTKMTGSNGRPSDWCARD